MKKEKNIVEVVITLAVPHYFTKEKIEETAHTSASVHFGRVGLDVISTQCITSDLVFTSDIPEFLK